MKDISKYQGVIPAFYALSLIHILISVYQEMGVDLAVLANNHVFDYGEVGLQDTLDTFRQAGLPYVCLLYTSRCV